jgi:hypothetical protein
MNNHLTWLNGLRHFPLTEKMISLDSRSNKLPMTSPENN